MDNIFPITPEPYPTESALGWLLRTSEENYLPSAWHVFKLSGLSQAYMTSPAFDPSLLAGWFNKKPEKLRYLSYRYLDDKRRLFQFREQCINSRMLDLRAPKICPCCISENGYIDALWDLELVIVCPTHGRSLIDRCPTCKKRLSWLRPGLLICRCGASLKNLVGIAQHNSVVMLHQHIKQIAHKEYRLCAMSGSNFEQSPFYGESLEFSLRLIRVIGAFCVFRVLRQNSLCPAERDRVVEEAANILSDWPNNFYRFLNDLANRPVRRNQYRVGIRGLIAEFMNALYGLTRDYSEGKNTLLQIRKFLTSHCEGRITGEFSKDILEDGTLPQWVCINTGAKILGVVSPTLLNILKTNKIRHRVERLSKSSIIHVFTADLKPELFGPTALISIRSAARRIMLPVSILKELRKTNDYVQTYFGPNSHRYAVRDIDNLFSRLAKIGDSYDSYPFPTITLNEALRIKLKNVSSKAEIIRGMLSGSIRVIKNSSDEWPHLLLNKEDLEKTVQTLLMPSEANWTLSQGAHAVNIHIAIFTDLVSQGAMAIACREPEIRIDPQSVLEFQKSYFRINSRLNFIEKKINMALNLCAELNLPHFLVFGVHSFMMKKDFHLIEKHVFSRPRNSKKKLSVASH